MLMYLLHTDFDASISHLAVSYKIFKLLSCGETLHHNISDFPVLSFSGPVLAFAQTIHMSASFISPLVAGYILRDNVSV